MPRLSAEKAKEYAEQLTLWTEKFAEVVEKIAPDLGNFLQRPQIIEAMGSEFPVKLYGPITKILMEKLVITKAGSDRGRGSGWAVMSLPHPRLPTAAEKAALPKKVVEKPKLVLKVAGECSHFARACLRSRVEVDDVLIVENKEEADYVADTANMKTIIRWYRKNYRRA